MKYSKYFKGVLHNDGLPQLNTVGWARVMNIAALEYGITKLQKVRELNQNTPELYKYDLMIRKEQELLLSLTENKEPKEFIKSMLHESLRW
jgi:hypothetical protein